MSHSLGSPSSPSSPISSRSSSGSSPSSPISIPEVQSEQQMVKLAKIYQKNGKDGTFVYKEWDGKEPEHNTAIFVIANLDNDRIKREVFRNCGDLIRTGNHWCDIQGEPLSFKIQDSSSSYPTTVGTYLKLSNSSSTLGQPLILDECWHHVTFLLEKLMRERKIFKFDPISGILRMSDKHKDVTEPDNYSFWLDLSGIPHTDVYSNTTFFNSDIFTEHIRSIPVSEFKNPSLYIPFYEYIPRTITRRRIAIETGSTSLGEAGRPHKRSTSLGEADSSHKRPKLGGKSRRRVKRRFKRKTIKRINKRNKRNKRKTIKRRFTPLKI